MRGCDGVLNFAAESHVDRSIMDGSNFAQTQVVGTLTLLEAARQEGVACYLQVSTDEVYGHVEDGASHESDAPVPRSPYSATKAGADLVVNSYHITHGLTTVITRGSNTYGPYQYPEKLLPVAITNALDGKPIPVYGDGMQVRDWLHVDDHCDGIDRALHEGTPGEAYNIGAEHEGLGHGRTNLDVLRALLDLLGKPHDMLQFVGDRPGHDRRYALDCKNCARSVGRRNCRSPSVWSERCDGTRSIAIGGSRSNRMPDTLPTTIETTATEGNSQLPAEAEPIYLRADLAAAKTSHYAARESGDTVEIVERPDGGFTLVLVDGQGHGFPAKLLSLQLTSKAVALIKEGVRDGAVARAVHDYLHAYRGGRVSATLDLLTLDLGTNSILVSRNADVPGVVCRDGEWELLPTASGPIGIRRHARPAIDHFELTLGLRVALFTDGIAHAGERYGTPLDVRAALAANAAGTVRAQTLADTLLAAAMAADRGLPNDDMTVVALTITAREERAVTRHLTANVPLIQRRRDG